MPGFIKTNKDIKLLVLYALSKFEVPLLFEELSQLTLVDDGINYFLLKQSVDELLLPENIVFENNCYSLTRRGRDNLESSLSDIVPSLRKRVDTASVEIKSIHEKRKYVRSTVNEKKDGTTEVHLALLNKTGVLFELQLPISEKREAKKICNSFQECSTTYFYAIRDVALKTHLPPCVKEEDKQIKSSISDRGDGTSLVHLAINKLESSFFEVQMMVPDQEEAQKICNNFQESATSYFHAMGDVAVGLTLPPKGEKREL